MPWSHCELELSDTDAACPECGAAKEAWTLEFEMTRQFTVATRPAVRLELVDPRHEPVADEPYEVTLPDGAAAEGRLDERGAARVESPAAGRVTVRFPERAAGVVELLGERELPPPEEEGEDGGEQGEQDERARFRCKTRLGAWRFCLANFRVRVQRDEEPLAEVPFRLEVGGQTIEGESWEDGVVRANVPEDAAEATLELESDPPLRLALALDLPPASEVAGAQGRLNNLGLRCGGEDGELGPLTAAALRRFQRRHGLERTGELDEATIAKLEQVHGG